MTQNEQRLLAAAAAVGPKVSVDAGPTQILPRLRHNASPSVLRREIRGRSQKCLAGKRNKRIGKKQSGEVLLRAPLPLTLPVATAVEPGTGREKGKKKESLIKQKLFIFFSLGCG